MPTYQQKLSNISQIPEQLTKMITSEMLQYTAGYYVYMTSRDIGYAIAPPINVTWVSTL
jgi:hypothetical protein